MFTIFESDKMGPPSLKIGEFSLWVHGREFPESTDFYDANWLNVTAHCAANGAIVWTQGAVLMTTDLQRWAEQCETLYQSLNGEAILYSFEPNLRVTINSADTLGHLNMQVEITSNHLNQSHVFYFEFDQSYLPLLVRQCRDVIAAYPIRGTTNQRP